MVDQNKHGSLKWEISSYMLKICFMILVIVCSSDAYLFVDSECMAPLPCHCGRNMIACAGHHFSSIPPFEPTSTHVKELSIQLPANNITSIRANAFNNINTTRATAITIMFQSNKIHQIDMDAFAGIEDVVVELRFEDNKLTGIPAALTRLTSLKKLRMEQNPITTIDATVMSRMSLTLSEFAMPAENLTAWPYGLSHMRHLNYLLIYAIPFHHLPLDAFYGFGSFLTELDISGSFPSNIPSAVCFLRNLKVLKVNSHSFKTPSDSLAIHEKCQLLLSSVDPFIHV